jgi:hypothetical protein
LHELPNQVHEPVGKLQPQAILPRESSPDFSTQDLVKRGGSAVGLAEVVDLGFQDFVPPTCQKPDSTSDLGESE